MIPKASDNAAGAPPNSGAVLFHVVIDDFARTYSIDGPETNAMRLHYEVLQAARQPNRKLREVEFRSDTAHDALALMKEHFPEYSFKGRWAK